MTQTLGLRATSFVASTALLGFAVIAAMSVTITLGAMPPIDAPVVPVIRLPEPPPPVSQPRARETPRPQTQTGATQTVAALPQEVQSPISDDVGFDPTPFSPEITNPRWLRRPQDLGLYYPRRAQAREITGEVLLDCRVLTSGALDCSIASESPAGYGFGPAALRIARDHRMAPATQDGVAVEARYRMRVPFELR